MKNQKYILTYLILLVSMAHWAVSQTTLQVVTKSVEKAFGTSQNLTIEAEKADIELLTWDKPEIKTSIELIAKHPDKKIASKDLETMKHVADKIGKEVFLRNYLLIQNEKDKPTSNLKAKYTIRIPEGMNITIKNSFGKISIKGKTKQLTIKSDFCMIELNDVEGIIKLDTHYGEINGNVLNGVSIINSERTDLTINSLSGDCVINNQYGKLTIDNILNLKRLKIEAKKSEVKLNKVTLKNYNFYVISTYGKVTLPNDFSYTKYDDVTKISVFNTQLSSKINISNSFGIITIN